MNKTRQTPANQQSSRVNQRFIRDCNRLPKPLLLCPYWLYRQLKPIQKGAL